VVGVQLVLVLEGGSSSLAALQAAAALRNLASNNTANQHKIRHVCGIDALVKLLRGGASSIAVRRTPTPAVMRGPCGRCERCPCGVRVCPWLGGVA
jgi:hypothetical protein